MVSVMAGYTRQASGNIVTGAIINADDLNDEYNAVNAAFDATTGHKHDGSTGEGDRIETIGPAGQLSVNATQVLPATNDQLTLGSTSVGFKDLFLADDRAVQFGASQDATLKYDEASTDTLLFGGANIRVANTNNKVEFRDADLSISSSSDGKLDIDADTELEIVAPTVDIQASTAITLVSDAITLGEAGDTDIVLTFNANSNDGVITWMEDEDHFKFSDDVLINSTEKLYFNDAGGEHIAGDADNLTISAGTDINLTATADVNIPSGVGLSFASDDAEKIESNGTDLTVNSGGDINLTATSDVNIPADVGVTFGDDGEKIEGDGTNLAISSSGDLNVTATTVDIDATTVEMSNDLHLNSDGAILALGTHQDVTVTHVADSGLTLKNTSTGDNTPFVLTLQTGEVAPEDNDVLGSIRFQAPDTSAGLDGALVTALIEAEAEATFSGTANNTAIVFKTATDGAATEKVRITAAGELKLGSANISEADLDQIDDLTAGTVTASKALVVDSNRDIATVRNVTSDGTIQFGSISDGTITATAFVDEDDMSSDSATLIPTQQSVKAYVDAQITAEDLDFQADSGGALAIDLDSETLTFTGGTGIDTSGSGNAVTFAIDSTVATLTGSQTMTNKSLTAPILTGSSSAAGSILFKEDTDNGTNAVTLIGPAATADVTVTLPAAATTLAGLAVAQEYTASQNFDEQALTDGSSVDWNLQTQQVAKLTLTGTGRTLNAATNHVAGLVCVLSIIQDGTGSRTIGTYNGTYKFAGGAAPTLTTTANARDILVFISDGTNLREIGRSLNVPT